MNEVAHEREKTRPRALRSTDANVGGSGSHRWERIILYFNESRLRNEWFCSFVLFLPQFRSITHFFYSSCLRSFFFALARLKPMASYFFSVDSIPFRSGLAFFVLAYIWTSAPFNMDAWFSFFALPPVFIYRLLSYTARNGAIVMRSNVHSHWFANRLNIGAVALREGMKCIGEERRVFGTGKKGTHEYLYSIYIVRV